MKLCFNASIKQTLLADQKISEYEYMHFIFCILKSITLWPWSASELYRPSDRRLSAMSVPIFADRGCHMVSATEPHGHILDFLDRKQNYTHNTNQNQKSGHH
jgi:hypothetical protein